MKKITSILLIIALALTFVACAPKEPKPDKNAVKAETPKTSGKLIMVTNCEFPPYEYVDGGVYKGIDVDIAKVIGSKLNVEVEILDVAFDSIIPTLTSGKADFAMAGMTVTEDRLQNVDFSHSYATAVQKVIVKEDSAIKDIDELTGKKIGVVTGFTADIYATGDFGDENIERFKNGYDAVQALIAGKIDAFMVDDQPAKNFVGANTGIKILDTPYAEEEYAAAVKKGNTELLNKINSVIDELITDGTFAKIVSNYIS